MSEEKIAAFLGLTKPDYPEVIDNPVEYVEQTIAEQEHSNELQKEVLQDIEYAKTNIKTVLEKATEAYDSLIILAKSSESPRAFEVASKMLKDIVETNKEFVNISEKKKFVKEELPKESETSSTNVTNNNLILTSSEFLKMIKSVDK